MTRAPFGFVVHDRFITLDVEGVDRGQALSELHRAAAVIYAAGSHAAIMHGADGEPILLFAASTLSVEDVADALSEANRWPVRHEYRGALGYVTGATSDRRAAEVGALAEVLRTDKSAHVLNTRELAERLYLRGVRVVQK